MANEFGEDRGLLGRRLDGVVVIDVNLLAGDEPDGHCEYFFPKKSIMVLILMSNS